MPITRDEALALLHEWTTSPALIQHATAVEAALRHAAHRFGAGVADEDLWGIAGLLHDADYDRWPDEHPRRVVAWLRERGEEATAHAVEAHAPFLGVPCESALDKALFACDELAGFVVACSLVRPGGIATLEPSSVKKKLKDKGFAAKVSRDDIRAGAAMLGVEIDEMIALVIAALRPIAGELGIAGASS